MLSRPLLVAAALLCALQAQAFSLDDVTRQARELAAQPYKAPAPLPPALQQLSYDEYRSIRFQPEHALWRQANLPFELQFFHAGRGFDRPLRLHELDAAGKAVPLAIPGASFKLPAEGEAPIAGFRVHYPLNKPGYKDEVISFLGASYFRAIGAGELYGLSARGLAVDTATALPEEFPAFTAFWIERPAKDARSLTLYALLDGPRTTGAYRFVVRPGAATQVDVQARIFTRAAVTTLGLAPLTSMFYSGENQPARDGGFRPEVHDSDGLLIDAGQGEWLWRPLTNPKQPLVTSFALQSPRGFGLLQRDRAFASYEDLEAHYERRPGVWIEPQGDWGAGRVELLQFHAPDETHDNVAAYWVPARVPAPGEALAVAYRMHWSAAAPPRAALAPVLQSRRGHGFVRDDAPPGSEQFHIDFAGPSLKGLSRVEAVVSGNANARGLKAHAYPNVSTGGWRMTLEFQRADRALTTEIRAFLRSEGKTVTETWAYAMAAE